MEGKGVITGVVSIRKCSQCGHHEVGIVTAQGNFYPLKPGMYVQVFPFGQKEVEQLDKREGIAAIQGMEKGPGSDSLQIVPWLPEILRRNKRLRLKYGVMVRPEEGQMDISRYKTAYIRKLQDLVEKEIYPNLAVILDNFFQSPHLAAGNSAEVTINLLRDIEELRRPIELMETWLENKTEDALSQLIAPLSIR